MQTPISEHLFEYFVIHCIFMSSYLKINGINRRISCLFCFHVSNLIGVWLIYYGCPYICLGEQIKYHDDVIKWKKCRRYWPFCAGNSPVAGEFPSQRPVTRSFDVLFDQRLNRHMSKWSRRWCYSVPFQISMQGSQQIFAHDTTATLSW